MICLKKPKTTKGCSANGRRRRQSKYFTLSIFFYLHRNSNIPEKLKIMNTVEEIKDTKRIEEIIWKEWNETTLQNWHSVAK
jgi:hypothetical protein